MSLADRHVTNGDQESPAQQFLLTAEDFRAIAVRVRQATGIVLGETKRDLVYSRLGRRLRRLGIDRFSEYLDVLDGPDGTAEQVELVNAITTNLTSFFRESHHFDALERDAIPEMTSVPQRSRRLRIWSAGCSSGEEPYSIAMSLRRSLPRIDEWDVRVLATDIDTNMIATCRAGRYEAAKAASIPADLARKFVRPAADGLVEMDEKLKQMIRFNTLNLLANWPMLGPFDVIFCRNVVIYFDKDTQRTLFDRFAEMLRPKGWLFIGHSESLFRVSDRFRHQGRTVYRKVR